MSSFIEYMAGPLPGYIVNDLCRSSAVKMTLWAGVEYTCEMNYNGSVLKLEVVAVVENHRFQHYQASNQLRFAFDPLALMNLSSLTHLYAIY